MAIYRYTGYDQTGGKIQGELVADSEQQANLILRKDGIFVSEIVDFTPEKETSFVASLLSRENRRLKLDDLEFFTAELALLLESGLKIDKALVLLQKGGGKPAIKLLLTHLVKEVRSGKQLSQALLEYTFKFDPLFINLIQIGEATGRLASVCRQLAEDLAFRKELRGKIIQAVTYPAVIFLVCLGSVFFIFNYIVPNMASLFSGKTDLPFYTHALLISAELVQKYQFYLLPLVLLLGFGVRLTSKDRSMQQKWHRLQLVIPFLKSAVPTIERIRFCSSMSMMLRSGVAIDTAMALAVGSLNNGVLLQELDVASIKIKRGESLSKSFGQTRLFPDFLATLLSVGEESGELAKVFADIAQRSQRDFTQWLMRLTTLLEPLMILIMGGLVGGVVVTMMLSITGTTNVGL